MLKFLAYPSQPCPGFSRATSISPGIGFQPAENGTLMEKLSASAKFMLTCMCMHIIIFGMRTTIELNEKQRAELLKLAAERGLKGFSQLIQEALNSYLKQREEKKKIIKAALKLKGSFAGEEGEAFEACIKAIRGKWR